MIKEMTIWEKIILIGAVVLLITGCAVTTWYVVDWIIQDRPPVATISTPTTISPEEDWNNIQSTGKMIVGVSADYSPFEYYNPQFEIVGFDPALMVEIGKKLGVQVEFVDFAFEGLGSALSIGQIDAAISAISVTPERQAYVDFSNIYLVSQDAIIAPQGTNISEITNLDQISPYRVGVQNGTIYENLIQTTLIDTQKMPQGNLYGYSRVDAGILDLQSGKLDLFMLDLQPAETYIAQGGVVLVGQNLNQQLYAIATRKGSGKLLSEINQALLDLNNEGKINELSLAYLNQSSSGIDPLPPTPTPPPQSTPTPLPPPPSCTDGMAYIQDLNLDDNNMKNPPVMLPGQPFTKGWRIKNTGTCSWNSSYFLAYASGNTPSSSMGGTNTPVNGVVPPGSMYDMYVNLVAPVQPGIYQGFWNMVNPAGSAFGQKVWVGIQVIPSPTATPRPTQTPSPSMQFTADRTVITAGEGVTFSWSVSGAQQVYFYILGQNYINYPVPSQGAKIEYPTQTTIYELRALYQNNTTEVRQIQIIVNLPPITAPKINKFVVTPTDSIFIGQCVNLQWDVTGTIDRISLLRNGGEIWGGAPASGTFTDCPPMVGTTVYAILANGPGGTSSQQDGVEVLQQPATPVPTPTPGPIPPTVEYFYADPTNIVAGNCVVLSWKAGGGTTNLRLSRNGQVILDNAPLTGQAQDCLQKPGSIGYSLVAKNPQGQQTQADVFVNVTAPPVVNPLPGSMWKLVAYFDGVGAMISANPSVTTILKFDSDTVFSGNAGCNDYNGNYQSSGTNIGFNPNIQTSMVMCDQMVMDQETRFLQLLPFSTQYEVLGSTLSLYDSAGQLILQLGVSAQPK
jgi:ABC-type amino acid transport substrate-binding protein/heat shock protein HslJ